MDAHLQAAGTASDIEAKRARQRAALERAHRQRGLIDVLASDQRARGFVDRFGQPYTYLVHRDTYPGREGAWRMSYFDRVGEPCGHTDARDYAEALRSAYEHGADIERELDLGVRPAARRDVERDVERESDVERAEVDRLRRQREERLAREPEMGKGR